MQEILKKMTPIFRDILEDDTLELTQQLTANDVYAWDSLAHVHLLIALEKAFAVKFDVMQVGELKNVGELAALIKTMRPEKSED